MFPYLFWGLALPVLSLVWKMRKRIHFRKKKENPDAIPTAPSTSTLKSAATTSLTESEETSSDKGKVPTSKKLQTRQKKTQGQKTRG